MKEDISWSVFKYACPITPFIPWVNLSLEYSSSTTLETLPGGLEHKEVEFTVFPLSHFLELFLPAIFVGANIHCKSRNKQSQWR